MIGVGRVVAVAVVALVAAAATATGGATAGAAAPARPTVVVTTNILGDIVGEVVGAVADVEVLMPAGADPHAFAISAAQAERMEQADLIVANGLGLEVGLLNNVAAAAADIGVVVLEVGPELDPIRYGDTAGDDARQFDPHVWTDPVRMGQAAELIGTTAVDELPGIDAHAVWNAADDYAAELDTMVESMVDRFDTIPVEQRQLVTNHHVFGYFAERFGFEVVGAVLPSGTTLASPSASDLDDLADVLRDTGVPAIFADSSQPARLAEVLAAEADLDVEVVELFTESLGPPGSGADTYLGMLDTNTERIVDALQVS